MSLLEKLDEVSSNLQVVPVEKGGRVTSVTGSTSSTDSVGVLGNVGGQVVEDDVGDVGDIQASSSDSRGDEDGRSTGSEGEQSRLSLSLRSVTVNRSGVVSLLTQEVAERVGHSLGLDKDEAETTRLLGGEEVEKERLLVVVVDVLDSLGDVLRGGTDSTDGKEDVVLEEGSGEHLDLLGEGSGEHEGLAELDTWHVFTLDDSPDLGLETHIQHSVSLVEDEVLDVGETDLASLDKVDESTRSGREEVTTSVESSDLLSNVGTTVDDGGSDPRSVGELPSLLVDLRDKLSGWGEDEGSGVGLSSSVASLGGRGDWAEGVGGGENGEEETTSLSGTSLGTGHQVSATSDDGDRVFLDWGGGGVSSKGNVLEENRVDGRVGELNDWLGNTGTSSFDWDIGVLVKVDTGGLVESISDITVELLLEPWVSLTDNVAVSPRSVAWSGTGAAAKASSDWLDGGRTPSSILAASSDGWNVGSSGVRSWGRGGETLLRSVAVGTSRWCGVEVSRSGWRSSASEVRRNVGGSLWVQADGLWGRKNLSVKVA